MRQNRHDPPSIMGRAQDRAAGFRVVGTRERIGRIGGVWRDVVMIERRSPVVGS